MQAAEEVGMVAVQDLLQKVALKDMELVVQGMFILLPLLVTILQGVYLILHII